MTHSVAHVGAAPPGASSGSRAGTPRRLPAPPRAGSRDSPATRPRPLAAAAHAHGAAARPLRPAACRLPGRSTQPLAPLPPLPPPPRLRCSRGAVAAHAAGADAPAAGSIYAEDGPNGRYLEAVVTSFHRVRNGAIVGLLCTLRCAGLPDDAR